MSEDKIKEICNKFNLEGEYISYKLLTSGHINTTYKVKYNVNNEIKSYIVQCINTYVFKNPIEVMENIFSITSHIKNRLISENKEYKRYVLEYAHTKEGTPYIYEDNSNFWRCYEFIDKSVTFNYTDNLKVIEETGKAFGDFQMYLSDYPVNNLNIVIPHFHNTINRYQIFKDAINNDYANRAYEVKELINEYLSLEDIATTMYKMQKENKLPLRVTHNDTKCNNVLFDEISLNHLSVIDLDTVMPGLVGFDFGDAIRFIANASDEDEEDLNKVYLDLNKFESFSKGFVSKVKNNLNEYEKQTLSLGAVTMAIECGMRFLTDYLDGDKYFKIDYEKHNLIRSKCQLKLAKDMIKKLTTMNDIIVSLMN